MSISRQKHITISWKQYDKDVRALARKVRASRLPLTHICAIPRGGYVVGVHLSHLLQLPLKKSVTKKALIVDDVSDTGKTLSKVIGKRRACVAVLYWKRGTKVVPKFGVRCYSRRDWLTYPWEK